MIVPGKFVCRSFLIIIRSRLLVYAVGSGVNRVQFILSGFSMRLYCFVQEKNFLYGWLYIFIGCTRACGCDGDVICVGHDVNHCTGWWKVVNSVGERTPRCGTPVLN